MTKIVSENVDTMSKSRIESRNSNIDLLKIIALLLIVLSHSIPYDSYFSGYDSFIDITLSVSDFRYLLLVFFRYLGQIGNVIFIICSSYYLVKEDGKPKVSKVINIILDSFIISVISLLFALIFKINMTTFDIIHYVFPIIFRMNWFIGCYLMLYVFHGLFNIIIFKLDKRKLFLLIFILFIMYFILSIIVDSFYYTAFVGFVCLYFFVGFMKNYKYHIVTNKKINLFTFIISFVLYFSSIIFINYAGLKISIFSNRNLILCSINNPFGVVLCFSLFSIFLSMKERNNKLISLVSSVSLFVYLIHANKILFNYVYPNIFDYFYPWFSGENRFIFSLIFAFIIFNASIIISIIYKYSIERITYYISKKISVIVKDLLEIVYLFFEFISKEK